MVVTGILVFTLTASLNEYFVCLRFRFPKLTVFVKGKNKVDFISKYLENVRDLDELFCPPMKELPKDFLISCSNQNKTEPWKCYEKLWHCSKIKSASLYQWL